MKPKTALAAVACLLTILAGPAGATETVLVLGDSLSAAHNMPMEAGWVHRLERQLTEDGCDVVVVNASISGDTSRGGLTRLPELLGKHHPAIVIIELGGNDGLRGLPLSELRGNLAAMIAMAREAGAKPLLTGIRIPTNYGPRYTQRFARLYGQIAEAADAALVPFLLAGIAGDDNAFQVDRIHPTDEAQPRIAANVLPHLRPLLSSCSPDQS